MFAFVLSLNLFSDARYDAFIFVYASKLIFKNDMQFQDLYTHF